METDVISTLADLGMVGVFILGAGGAGFFFIMLKRNNHKGNNGQHVMDMFVQHNERIATSLERFVTNDERMLDWMKTQQESLDELVTLHVKMEERRKVLGQMVSEE